MKTAMGILLGLALTPAVLGLMALFVWVSMTGDLNKSAVAFGGACGVLTFLLIIAITVWYFAP